jgi:hypothetical protein
MPPTRCSTPSDDERRARHLGDGVGGHDRPGGQLTGIPALAPRRGAEAVGHPLHRQRAADHPGAADQHLDGIAAQSSGGERAHPERIAQPLGARAGIGIAGVGDDGVDRGSAAQGELGDDHRRGLDQVPGEDAGARAGAIAQDHRDVGARHVAVAADAGRGGAER